MTSKVRSTIPAPTNKGDEEVMLDEVIERIDQSLPVLHQRASNGSLNGSKKPPTDRISKRAQKVFKDMCEDPLLNDDESDIRITKINGTHP